MMLSTPKPSKKQEPRDIQTETEENIEATGISAAVKDTICLAQTVLSAVTPSNGHILLEVLEVLEVPPPASSLTTLHPSYSALQTW